MLRISLQQYQEQQQSLTPSCVLFEALPSKRFLHIGKFPVNTQPVVLCKYVADKLSVKENLNICNSLTKTKGESYSRVP